MYSDQKEKIMDSLPILAFVVSYFFFHVFHWMEATQVIWAALVGLLTYLALATDFKMDHKNLNFKRLNFYSGLLTALFIIMFLQGFVHWKRMLPLGWRMGILFLLVLIYFIFLLRAMRVLSYFRLMAEKDEEEKHKKIQPEKKSNKKG